MRGVRSKLVPAAVVACCLAPVALAPRSALAQLDRGTRERALDAFHAYDLAGPATIEALALLAEQLRAGQAVVGAPRLAYARAATDLWLVSWLDPEHAHLERDVAGALGVPSFALPGTLLEALDAVGDEALRARADELAEAIELRRAIESDEPVSLTDARGLRRDAILVHLVGTAIEDGDDAELAAWYDDPCAAEVPCGAPWSGWAPSSRAVVAALVEAADALARLDEAWSDGDPFARAVLGSLDDDARRLELHVHVPAPATSPASGATGQGLEPVGIREGRLVAVDRAGGDEAPDGAAIPVPSR